MNNVNAIIQIFLGAGGGDGGGDGGPLTWQ
jgi:hypothetical protein